MLRNITDTISSMRRIFRVRFDKTRITETEQIIEFVHTRSAYVAQTSLYGYLKTRMGRSYVSIFKDERFAPSLNTAKWKVYAACLSDLTVYAVSLASRGDALRQEEKVALAIHCHNECVHRTFEGEYASKILDEAKLSFARRAQATIWENAAVGQEAFSESPDTLADSSPVSDEFRELDREIVTNSVRFRWNDVRDQLRRRLDGAALAENWRAQDRERKAVQGTGFGAA